MISDIFIARPRLAFVVSVVMVLAGLIALTRIPVAQYPDIVPPQVTVTTTFPGASATTVEASVAEPIEAQVNGVDKAIYMASTSGNDGSYTLTVGFAVGSDPNIDAVNVQNRVTLAEAQLPAEVNQQGLTIRQRSSALLQVIEFFSPNQSLDSLFLNNYVTINVLDTIARVPGVGQAQLFANLSYGMRIWLDTDRLTGFSMVPGDVIKAVQQQNTQAALGRIGAQPSGPEQQRQLPLDTVGRLAEAFVLVVLVVFLFLGSWRATLVPIVTVPVSLIGAFAVLFALGYSANTITLLALVLAIGIVVDDAIVVVENVQRIMEEEGLAPAEAARKAMREITGPIIAITLVLLSVFVPIGFIPGITGALYRQFAVAVSAAVIISAINALTLSPALCALLLRPGSRRGLMARLLGVIDRVQSGYASIVRRTVGFAALSLLAVAIAGVAAFALFRLIPTGFLPEEDQGFFYAEIDLPPGASVNRTDALTSQVEKIIRAEKGVAALTSIIGFSQLNSVVLSNAVFLVVRLAPFEERTDPSQSVSAVIARIKAETADIPGASILLYNAPPIIGLGSTGGFQYELESVGAQSPADLAATMRALVFEANQQPELANVFSTYAANSPQVYLDIDRDKAQILGVAVSDIFQALQATMGSFFINQFNAYGRVWQVNVQADAKDRSRFDDIYRVNVSSPKGEMIPLRALMSAKTVVGPQLITRYNNLRAVNINGAAAPGRSSGEALAAMERASQKVLPPGYTFEWTGTALRQQQAAGQTLYILGIAVAFAYLFLVALYESLAMPLAVLFSIAIALLGAMVALRLSGLSGDQQECDSDRRIRHGPARARRFGRRGGDCGARMRVRPVLMTSLAFVLGLAPLVFATGVASLTRRGVGTAVFGGMIVATALGVFAIPLLYIVFQRLRSWRWLRAPYQT